MFLPIDLFLNLHNFLSGFTSQNKCDAMFYIAMTTKACEQDALVITNSHTHEGSISPGLV